MCSNSGLILVVGYGNLRYPRKLVLPYSAPPFSLIFEVFPSTGGRVRRGIHLSQENYSMATNPTAGIKPDDYNEPIGAYIGYRLVTAASICMGLSTVFVGLRIWTRRYVTQMLGTDDYLMGVAWLFASILSISDIIQCKYGTGTHLWEVEQADFQTFLKLQMVVGNFYAASLPFAKCSILVFYLRLSKERTFRIMVYATIAFISAYATAAVLVIIFSCNPVAGSWDLAIAALPDTTCVNRPINYLAQASLNIFSDVLIILLPMHTIWKLQMPLSQRLSVIAIFTCGIFVCIVSIVRLKSIMVLLDSPDLTWDTTDVLIWSTLESHVTIICACSAHLRPLFTRFLPGFSRSASRNNYSQYPSINRAKFEIYKMDDKPFPNTTTVTASARKGCDSQESILGQSSQNVYVTQTVQIT